MQKYVMNCQIIQKYFEEFKYDRYWNVLHLKNIFAKELLQFHNIVECCPDNLIMHLIIISIIKYLTIMIIIINTSNKTRI